VAATQVCDEGEQTRPSFRSQLGAAWFVGLQLAPTTDAEGWQVAVIIPPERTRTQTREAPQGCV
jgi:hypothetical protein